MTDAGLDRWLRTLPGKRITALTFAVFIFEDRVAALNALRFSFDGAEAGSITTDAVGNSLRYNTELPDAVDMNEYGKVALAHEYPGIDVTKIVGSSIVKIESVMDGAVPMGFALKLDNGSEVMLLNAGDALIALLDGDHGMLHDPAVKRRALA
jgi:hypothetical protein